MNQEFLIHELRANHRYFLNVIAGFDESESNFTPYPGAMTVAAQVHHVAFTLDWFNEGAFGSGFDMNFEEHVRQAREVTSLAKAIATLQAAMDRFIATLESKGLSAYAEHFPEGQLMSGPKYGILIGAIDHTCHHRGILTQYLKALGKTPAMPYM